MQFYKYLFLDATVHLGYFLLWKYFNSAHVLFGCLYSILAPMCILTILIRSISIYHGVLSSTPFSSLSIALCSYLRLNVGAGVCTGP